VNVADRGFVGPAYFAIKNYSIDLCHCRVLQFKEIKTNGRLGIVEDRL
jgi:hypothetical protein